MRYVFSILAVLSLLASCTEALHHDGSDSTEYAEFFRLIDSTGIITVSPFDGHTDTLIVERPFSKVICMSSSHVAFFDALSADSVVVAVSGLSYISSPELKSRSDVYDIGYEPELDYERILTIRPDVLLSYSTSAVAPSYISKLKVLGIKVLDVHEHLESHPLARAEYIKLFSILCGRRREAELYFNSLRDRYVSLSEGVSDGDRVKVLMNIPYGNQWFIPGRNNYMSKLIQDAGGEILGSKENSKTSGVISVEQAYMLSKDTDIWLHPGTASSKEQLLSTNPLFKYFGIDRVYNNTLRMNSEGGNDFFESGNLCPDLILEDLISIFRGEQGSLHYYLEVE